MTNTIGDVRGVSGSSVALNNQPGQGTQKPNPSGSRSPNDVQPTKPGDGPVPMPK